MAHDFTGDASIVFLDIETNTKHDQIWCCVTKKDGITECHTEPSSLRKLLKKTDTIVGHNALAFDIYLLNKLWGFRIKRQQVMDTLILSRLLSPSRENGHSLAAWGNRLGYPKIEFSDYDAGLSDEMIQYCIRDVEVLERVYYALEDEKRNYGFSEQSITLEHEVAAIISRQERRGFRLDVPFTMVLASQFRDKAAAIEQELQQLFPPIVTERISEKTGKRLTDKIEVFNPGSRQQISKRLIDLGWKPTKKTEKGSVIVDEKTLEEISTNARYASKPVLVSVAAKLQEYLLLSKRHSQVQSWLDVVQEDGRVRGKVITNGAVTGRATHHSPNMAQIPNINSLYGKECRQCWTVEEGHKLVGIDLAQLELRCLAHYMKDDEYTKELLSGDIHTKNQQAAGLSTRSEAKTFIFALCYGAGAEKIGLIAGVDKTKGQQLIDRFLANTPSLKKLREKVERLSEKGFLPGLDGRILHIRSPHAALNTLLQSAGAIVSKQWMVELNKMAAKEQIEFHQVAWVHDELQCEVREESAERLGQLAVEAAKKVTEVFDMRCPMDAEYHVGNNWADSH
jgi:DNA polymerase I-like protein with 3'-5' exonuclease and polymerase domains